MTWILGFTYFANGSEWMAILFTLLNSLQGVFILLFHVVLNDKAKQELLRHLKSTKSEVKVMTLLNNCRSCQPKKFGLQIQADFLLWLHKDLWWFWLKP